MRQQKNYSLYCSTVEMFCKKPRYAAQQRKNKALEDVTQNLQLSVPEHPLLNYL